MDISLDNGAGHYQIKSYSAGKIQINGTVYTKPTAVSLDELTQDKLPNTVLNMTKEDLEMLNIVDYEAVLLGTGENLQQMSWEIIEAAQMMGAPLEIMSTGAACRTFTILASEGRRVLAILYP